MNWEALGSIAELLAATGVIITLIYLARQLRMNNEQQLGETHVLFDSSVHASKREG